MSKSVSKKKLTKKKEVSKKSSSTTKKKQKMSKKNTVSNNTFEKNVPLAKSGLKGAKEFIAIASTDPKLMKKSSRDFEKELLGDDFETDEEFYAKENASNFDSFGDETEDGETEGLPGWWKDSPASIVEAEEDEEDESFSTGKGAGFDDSDEWTEEDGWVDDKDPNSKSDW